MKVRGLWKMPVLAIVLLSLALFSVWSYKEKEFLKAEADALDKKLSEMRVRLVAVEEKMPHAATFLSVVSRLQEASAGKMTASEIVNVSRRIVEFCGNTRETGISEALVFAVMERESAFNPKAISSAYAYGLMQVLFSTAVPHLHDMGVTKPTREILLDPVINVEVGMRELVRLREAWLSRGVEDWNIVLSSYYWGEKAILILVSEKNRAVLPSLEYGTDVLKKANVWRERGV